MPALFCFQTDCINSFQMVKGSSSSPDLLKCKLLLALGEMKGCFLSDTLKRSEIPAPGSASLLSFSKIVLR